MEAIFDAMAHFRNYRKDTAHDLLDQVADSLQRSTADQASPTPHLVRRWYLSARAYEYYLGNDLSGARASMAGARKANLVALNLSEYLMPFATQTFDYLLQTARIARRENLWPEVKERLQRVQRMLVSEEPLCVLENGRRIYLASIAAFFDRLPLDPEEKRHRIDLMTDQESNTVAWERVAEQVYTLPDFVIPYP